jgi:hypothetical protein
MHRISARTSLGGVSRAALAAALGGAVSCAGLLDIPSDPKLVSDAPSALGEGSSLQPDAAPYEMEVPSSDAGGGSGGGGELVEEPARLDPPSEPSPLGPPTSAPLPGALDDGSTPTDAGVPVPEPEPGCTPPLVDIVLMVDNSGSMGATTQQAELALPAFALRLEEGQVDFRIILISRHRVADRDTSTEASTSVCVAAPLSGLSQCPAPQPSPTSRFFQYSTKLDATDSFERTLEAATTPDIFGLTSVGWLEWLRPGSDVEMVEVTDANSALGAGAFVSGLAALAPQHFSATLTDPGFVFHTIAGMSGKLGQNDVYLPNEPIELQICTRLGGNPDNAGVVYQGLSRSTGGLRQPICPATSLATRLNAIATDVIERNASACPSD